MPNNNKIINRRYYSIASGFRTARYIFLIFLTVFLFCLYFIYSGQMTLDHFKYFIRNLEFNPSAVLSAGEVVYFDSDEDNICEGYKGGVAVLGSSKVSLYDVTSSVVLSEYHGYTDPQMVVSDKYILVHDKKSAKLTVYSAFSKLKEIDTERAVSKAVLSDEGTFAFVTDDDDYYSIVSVYNSNFNIINKISLYKYVRALDLSSDGKTLIVSGVYIGETGEFCNEISLMKTGADKPMKKIELDGSLVYDCRFFKDLSFVILSSDALRFYSPKGEIKKTVNIKEDFPDYYHIEDDNIIFIYNDDAVHNKCKFRAYDKNGSINCETVLEGEFADMCANTHQAYIILDRNVVCVSVASGKCKTYEISEDAKNIKSIIRGANEDIFVCTPSGAYKLDK